jgi:hypothetical protein
MQVTLGFAISAHIGFGHNMPEFASVPSSFNTLLLWAIGSIRSPPSEHSEPLYILFFWAFVLIGTFVLINILLSNLHTRRESSEMS